MNRDKHQNAYQWFYNKFDIKKRDKLLDVGCGNNPFPEATVLIDANLGSSGIRSKTAGKDKRPYVCADISCLPFNNKEFDFVYCSHVLEHVDDPIMACREIMRVGKRGYIETPTFGKDMLFAWAKGRHKWHVVSINNCLCFFEYSSRQLEGIRSQIWRDNISRTRSNPIKSIFFQNLDMFNLMFNWTNDFKVSSFHLNGTITFFNKSKILNF